MDSRHHYDQCDPYCFLFHWEMQSNVIREYTTGCYCIARRASPRGESIQQQQQGGNKNLLAYTLYRVYILEPRLRHTPDYAKGPPLSLSLSKKEQCAAVFLQCHSIGYGRRWKRQGAVRSFFPCCNNTKQELYSLIEKKKKEG